MDRDDIVYFIVWIILYAILFTLFNFLAAWLWEVIAVGIFGLPVLGYWKMFGLRILLGFLFPTHISLNELEALRRG